MSDQVETKQVTWQEMEVAEEQCQGCFDPQCGQEKPFPTDISEIEFQDPIEEPMLRGVILLQGIDEEAWNEAVEKFYMKDSRGMILVQVAQAYRQPPSVMVNTNILPEDVEKLREQMGDKMERLHRMYVSPFGAPLCTAHRAPITGQWNLP